MRSSKFLASAWGPPVLEVAVGVELAALVVEGVGELVADGGAGVAVVGGVVELDVVKGRLEHSGGEVDVVHLRVEVGVDGGRSHAPLVEVDGLAELVPLARVLKLGRAQDVAEVVVGFDRERGVIAPGVGVADLVADGVELAQRFLLGVGTHPVEGLDLLLHGGLDLLGHELRAGLHVGGEGAADELLAESFAERIASTSRVQVFQRGGMAGTPRRVVE